MTEQERVKDAQKRLLVVRESGDEKAIKDAVDDLSQAIREEGAAQAARAKESKLAGKAQTFRSRSRDYVAQGMGFGSHQSNRLYYKTAQDEEDGIMTIRNK